MTINLKKMTAKNFLSIGAIEQELTLSEPGITLALGENLDLGGNGNRNGVGKCLRGDTNIDVIFDNTSIQNKFEIFMKNRKK